MSDGVDVIDHLVSAAKAVEDAFKGVNLEPEQARALLRLNACRWDIEPLLQDLKDSDKSENEDDNMHYLNR
jgi:hypothetical protein